MAINSLSAASKGLSGLVSGMDTEQMVNDLLAGTKSKIDTATQKKTQLEYKQELYRTLITKMNTFNDKYFSFSSSTNLLSTTLFNTMNAVTEAKAFKVTASSGAQIGTTVVDQIKQLATAAAAKSSTRATGTLSGTLNVDKIKSLTDSYDTETVTFKTANGAEKSITLGELVGKKAALNSAFEIEQALKDKLGDDFAVSYSGGRLNVVARDGSEVTITGKAESTSLAVLGLKNASTTAASFSLSADSSVAGLSMTMNLNGVSKAITVSAFNAGGQVANQQELADNLNAAAQKAFGSKINVGVENDEIRFKVLNSDGTDDPTSQVTLTHGTVGTSVLTALGIASGKSNKINTNMTLKEANFSTTLAGKTQRFTINGVDFSFDSSASISSIMSAINASDAGVKISYSSTEDLFRIESTVSGAKAGNVDPFEMSQSEGNLLSVMFGIGSSGAMSGSALSAVDTAKGTAVDIEALAEKVKGDIDASGEDPKVASYDFNFTVDGKEKTVNIEFKSGEAVTADTIAKKLNAAIKDSEDEELVGKLSFSATTDADGQYFSVKALGTATVQMGAVGGLDLGLSEGTEVSSAAVTGGMKLATIGLDTSKLDIEIDGTKIDLDGVTTVADLAAKMQEAVRATDPANANATVRFDETKGAYRIYGVEIPMEFKVAGDDGKLFGTNEAITLASAGQALTETQKGQNAVVVINGIEIERSTNNFTVDGLSFELKATMDTAEDVIVSRDTDKIFDTISQFVKDYNEMVNAINEQLDAKPTYREYAPLTAEQEDEMTETQVKLWEEKARGGLLRNDSTLQNTLTQLRGVLYTKPEGGLALYDIGITTSYFGTKDNLDIDEDKLREMISANAEGVQKLFTDTEKGLSTMLKNAIDKSASTSYGTPGSLVRMAGAEGRTDTESSIYKQIKDVNERIESLEDKYDAEYKRYWSQFNAMEQMISQMNQQSSWLSSQFS